MKRIFYILNVIAVSIVIPGVVLAADLGLSSAENVGGLQGNLVGMIGGLITTALGLVGALALAMIVYGGFLYITAAGDDKQITKAKTVIIYAVIGIIVIGVSYALVEFVVGAFGESGGTGVIGNGGSGSNGVLK